MVLEFFLRNFLVIFLWPKIVCLFEGLEEFYVSKLLLMFTQTCAFMMETLEQKLQCPLVSQLY